MKRAAALLLALLLLAPPLLEPQAARAQEDPAPRPRAPGLELVIEWLDLRAQPVEDALRLLGQAAGANVVCTVDAAKKPLPALTLQEVPVRRAVETVCKVAGLWYREDEGILRVMTAEEYRKDLVVQRTPKVKVFTLLHPNAVAVAGAIRDLYGSRVQLSYGLTAEVLATPLAAANAGLGTGSGGTGGAGNGLQGFGTSLLGSGANRFTSSLGNQSFGQGFGNFGQSQGGANAQADEEKAARLSKELTPEQLSRLKVEGGKVQDVEGLTEARPPIAITVNRRQNLIVVRTADEEALGEIERLVLQLDRPTPQVLLEVKVLQLDLGDDFRTALDVDLVSGPQQQNIPTGEQTNPVLQTASTVARNLVAAGNPPLAGGALVYQFLNDHVRVRLEALETEGRLGVLATPLLLCANNQVSRIFIGEERPLVRSFELQTTTTNGVVQTQVVPTVDLRDIGNTLRLVPSINADRTVTLTIVQDVSSVNIGGATLPVPNGQGGVSNFAVDTVTTANLEGTVVAKDGLTLAVGGLIRKEMVDRTRGIPYLMDIPLIGWLFGETVRTETHRELILIITPHVLTTPAEGQEVSRRRMEALSLHPYHDLGDRALQRYSRHDAPGAADYGRLVEDYLLPWNEPIR
ncbi:MAG: type II secretion system protein GspD [Planctomycetota bacterium]